MTTRAIKDVLIETFDKKGGVDSLLAWANDNPTEFYKLWAKLLPAEIKTEITATPGATPITEVVVVHHKPAAESNSPTAGAA